MDIISKFASAITDTGIRCGYEYPRKYGFDVKKGEITAFAGIKSITLNRLRDGLADVTAAVRVTVQAFGSDGENILSAAEKKVLPAVMKCGEEIYSAVISEVMYDGKSDRVYCEIIFEVRRDGCDICGG